METRITHLFDSKRIKYSLLSHEKPVFTCEDAAKERKVPLDEMIKCILLVDKKKNYFLACITADKMIDTQKVRAIMNCSRLSFASKQDIEEILGYKIGAIPPLLLKTEIPILFDKCIMKKDKVNISSGNPKAGLDLNPKDLIPLIKPRFGNITK
jgi:prolyl-tRNA editing enzyme YbaK/EbsC (Cys-tRNA(Pro) deacylase)